MAKKRHHPKPSQFTPEVWIALINQVGGAAKIALFIALAAMAPSLAQDGLVLLAITKAMSFWTKL